MSTWPNRGASGGPCGGLEERKSEPKTVRPTRLDSSQQASSKPGAVHTPSSRVKAASCATLAAGPDNSTSPFCSTSARSL